MKIKIFIALVLTNLLCACGQDEFVPFDEPFIHVMKDEQSKIEVAWNRADIVDYSVYLSSKPLKETLEVGYSFVVGDGLKEGVDFQRVTKGEKLFFPSGIYDMPIRIKWLANKLDKSLDNTITIRLESVNIPGINLGLPGADQNQREIVIEKINH